MLEKPPGNFRNVTQTNTVNHIQEAESQLNHVQSQSQLNHVQPVVKKWESELKPNHGYDGKAAKTQPNRTKKNHIPTIFKNTNQPYSKQNQTVFKNPSNRIQNACNRILGNAPNRIFFAGETTEIAIGLGSKNAQAKTLSGNTVGGVFF